jgi:hypothetical protein
MTRIQLIRGDDELLLEALAENIEKVAAAGLSLKNSRLSERAILLLLSDASGTRMAACRQVLDALPLLKDCYVKSPKE